MNMDLTNLSEDQVNETREHLQQGLLESRAATEQLKKQVAKDEAANNVLLEKTEERKGRSDFMKQKQEENRNVASIKIHKEVEKLKSLVSLKQQKLETMRTERKSKIDDLKNRLESMKKPSLPEIDESTLTTEKVELMEVNTRLEDDIAETCKLITEKNTQMLDMKERHSSLQAKLNIEQEYLSTLELSLNEFKQNNQAKSNEKVRLETLLQQLNNPHSQASGKGDAFSLFDEVHQKASTTASQYKQIKKKYRAAKQLLDQIKKEMSDLEAKIAVLNKTLNVNTAEKADINQCLESYQSKRIKELEAYVAMLKERIESWEPIEISPSNTYLVFQFARAIKNKVKLAEQQVCAMLGERISLERSLEKTQSLSESSKEHLKSSKLEKNKLEEQIQQYKDRKLVPKHSEVGEMKQLSEELKNIHTN